MSSSLIRRARTAIRHDVTSPLYRNAYALMLSTVLTSLLGFAYWVLAARLYDVDEVGAGAALITTMMLISVLTQINLVQVLIRFLPRAGSQTTRLLAYSYAIAAGFGAFAASIVLLVVSSISDGSWTLDVGLALGTWFVVSTASWSLFCLQDAALTGLRKTLWIPLENATFGVVKLIALVACVAVGGAAGIFLSWTIPVALALLPVNHFIFRRFATAHADATKEREQALELGRIREFMVGDYIGNISAQLSVVLMPILVVVVIDEKANGYFYIAQTISTALDLIAINLAASLTVEASDDEQRLAELTRATLRRTLMIIAPLAVVLMVAATPVMAIFGSEYADNSTTILRLLLLASVIRAATAVYASLCRVLHQTRRSGEVQVLQAFVLLSLSLALMPHFDIAGIGVAAVLAQCAVASFVVPQLINVLRHHSTHTTGPGHGPQGLAGAAQ